MTRPMWVKHSSAAIAALALVLAAPPGSAQQPPSSGPATLFDKPQVFRTAAATIRVTAVKGLVYPWALAFLPSGDILVTEQSRNTLRIIRNGVLDAAPITGLPLGITSERRDTAGVDIALHPRFAENRLVYVTYWKPRPGNANLRTAVLVRGRFDGGTSLADVREIFASSSWTDGPSAARIVFGRDGKIYMSITASQVPGQQPKSVAERGSMEQCWPHRSSRRPMIALTHQPAPAMNGTDEIGSFNRRQRWIYKFSCGRVARFSGWWLLQCSSS